MRVSLDGLVYEGTEDEIRRIVENPPKRPPVEITNWRKPFICDDLPEDSEENNLPKIV